VTLLFWFNYRASGCNHCSMFSIHCSINYRFRFNTMSTNTPLRAQNLWTFC